MTYSLDLLMMRFAPSWALALFLIAATMLLPQAAHAQASGEAEFVEPSDRQYDLNDDALSQMNEGEYAKAAGLLQESLQISPLNITYLNLGRSYQMMGRCEDARDALRKVYSAPMVRSPEPALIEKTADEYLSEIGESDCSADPEGAAVGTALGPLPDTNRAIIGWTSIGAGAALMGVGVLFQLQAAGLRDEIRTSDSDGDGIADNMTRETALDKRSQANTFSTLALATFVGGAISAGIGGYLLSTESSKQNSNVGLYIGPGGGRLVWSLRF